ncbi:hypothetical protein [Microbacterium sp. NPDC056052]|uniref:hypothetical protein n=1 Tax=Microbacterium sp. NPDC056052 TaxID=3345695 RepID=UPI0035DF3465
MPKDDSPRWHPMLATVEPEPGVWVMIDSLQRPYGLVRIVKVEGLTRFRAEHIGTLLGYSTTLRAAVERVHDSELRSMFPGSATAPPVSKEPRMAWVAEIRAKYSAARPGGGA